MTSRRLIVLGVLAFVFGVGAVVDGTIAGAVPVSTSVATAIGVGAAGIGVYIVWAQRPETLRETPEPPETVRDRTPVGAEFSQEIESLTGAGPAAIRHRREIRQQLEELARGVLTTHGGVPSEEAEEALRSGTWTENPHAAAYFRGEYPEWAALSLRVRAATLLQPSDTKKLKAALTELEAIVDNEEQ